MQVCRKLPLFRFTVNLSLFSEGTYWLIFVETRFGGARDLWEMNDKLEKFKAVHAHIASQLQDSVEVKVREVVVFANLDRAKQTTGTDQEGSSIPPRHLIASSQDGAISTSRISSFCHLLIPILSSRHLLIFILSLYLSSHSNM